MENSKRLRGRSRSSSNFESETSANIDITIEEPSNLNGDKNESDNKKDVQNDQAESLQQVSTDIIEGESSPDEKINDESVNTKVSEMKDSVTVNQENVKDTLEDTTAKNAVLDKIDIVEVTERNEEKKEVENPKEKVPKGRKRKISELKSLESGKIEKEQELQVLIKDEVDVDLYPSGTVEPLGKGKRARIPNKRYSDIVISPPKKVVNPPSVENGNAEKLDSGNDTDSSSIREYVLSPRSSTSSPSLYRTKVAPDLSDPKYAKPFKFGWKRELVWRGTYDESKGRIGDIYYYAPDGKKVRSKREVAENLKHKSLTIENFSFFKELIGIGGDKEIEREAKTIKSQDRLVKQAITKSMKNAPRSPKIRSPKLAKLTSPKLSSPKVASPRWSPKALHTKVELNETADSPAKQKRTPKNAKIAKTKTPLKKEVKKIDEKPISSRRGRKPSYEDDSCDVGGDICPNKPCQPCSIRCRGVHGIVPTLQCRICLCLYHHECVGVSPALISLPYVCKNCHLEGQEQTPIQSTTLISTLPPLTPINVLKSAGNQPTTLPKLQRIPRPSLPHLSSSLNPNTLPEPPKLIPRPQPEELKSLVGSLTTWLPHNSKIIDNIQEVGESPTGSAGVARPQYVEILAGRKFLVIPKHNFMSISPTVATTAVTRSEDMPINVDTASLGSDPVSDIKIEFDTPSKPETAAEAGDSGAGKSETTVVQKNVVPTAPVSATTTTTTTTTSKKRTIKLSSITNTEDREEHIFMENYLQNLSYGYNTLLYVFQYLKVQDLLRAGCVCTMWRDIAGHPILWKTVRMKNSQVHSFEGLANSLKKHCTKHLDLRKMLLPNGGDEIWPEFSKAIAKVETLRRIELCRCPASVVENLGASNPLLEAINAVTIKCESMNLEPLKILTQIQELRLKSTGGLTLTSNIDSLKEMKALKHLSLTSIRDLDHLNLGVIAQLTNLESLDLGECMDFPKNFGSEILIQLKNLERLRLEKGQGNCHTFEILEAVKQMDRLDQLELVNFDIKSGFDKALGVCYNIRKLLIIPTYISQSATTNHMVLGGVLRLQKTLSHFVWGVTLELLRVTELFVDQCEDPKEKKEKKQAGNGDCIPVLKPVPLLDGDSEIPPALDPPQVEILALPSLQKLLMQNLPTTRVKILKIPFHATWRQSITDSVN